LEIIIFAPASPTIGGSHATRMKALAKILSESKHKILFFKELKSLRDFVNQVSKKTFIIIDVPSNFNDDLAFLYKNNLVLIGYEYSGELRVDYNIVPFFFKSRQFKANKVLYSGLEFLILRPEIKLISSKSITQKRDVVISLGAGDTLAKAEEIRRRILKVHKDFNVIIILGKYSVYKSTVEKYITIDPFDFYDIVNAATYVVTNAGTTLVEAIYFEKKILAWPQNELELEFALYLKQFYKFEIISETMYEFNLNKITATKFQNNYTKNKLDGGGVHRVQNLIYDIVDTEMGNFYVL
jgi:spore coat polysaccharide biosynthesis predicted glycosyltransferase SpsG